MISQKMPDQQTLYLTHGSKRLFVNVATPVPQHLTDTSRPYGAVDKGSMPTTEDV
jgi:hypothetical protein